MRKLFKNIFIFCFIFLSLIFLLNKKDYKYTSFPVYKKEEIKINGFTKKDEQISKSFIKNNSTAKFLLFLPDKNKTTKQVIIICPGGGYQYLAYYNEGINVAYWLRKKGITTIVLLYRMPNKNYYNIPFEDLQQTIKIVRNNAEKWNIDKNKVGIMGFSAGGHLAAIASNRFKNGEKPNFTILFYPVITMNDKYTHQYSKYSLLGLKNKNLSSYFSAENSVTPQNPPTYIAFSQDDNSVNTINSELYYNALVKNKVPVEIHRFKKGGHGWGWSKKFKYHKEVCRSLLKWLNSL